MKFKFKLKTLTALLLSTMMIGCSSSAVKKPLDTDDKGNLTEVLAEITTEELPETTEATTYYYDTSTLSNEKQSWYFNPNDTHEKPTCSDAVDLNKYSAYYVDTSDDKVIYLTFDEGYENGYSSKILDVLKEKNVKAAFFVTKPYIEQNQDLIKRMVAEGHIVGNHSVHHLSSPDLSDEEFKNEILETAEYFKEVTGEEMPHVFRPPMGEYSERTLALTQMLGYKTILWSFAHMDWVTDNQPSVEDTYNKVMSRTHNGCVALLHAVSSSNTAALPRIIDSLRAEGYEFKTLDQIK